MKSFTRQIMVGALGAWTGSVHATEYHAHGLLGAYVAKETVKDGAEKSSSNDQEAVLGRLFFDATRMGGVRSQFTLDVRDRYDSFGAQDQDRPRLVPSNDAQIRQLALKYPFESGRLYAALGRVPIIDAAVIGNDGLDVQYRMTNRFRLGGFAGLYPELRYGVQPSLAQELPQGGLYGIYDDKSAGWEKHTLISSAIVSRQKASESAVLAGETPPSDQESPSLMLFANAVHQASADRRYTGLAQLDLAPHVSARNVWLGWHASLTPGLSSTLSLVRIDPTGYNRQRDALDTLQPSVLTRVSADLRHQMNREWTLLYDGAFGTRSADQRTRIEAGTRAVRSGLIKGRLSLYGGFGFRKNYISQDLLARAGATYAWNTYDLALHQQVVSQKKDDGTERQSFVSDVTGSALFSDSILGTLTVEYAQAGSSRSVSGMAGIGFRFGSGQETPSGPNPAPPTPVERL